jgi:hypothetical protein
LEDIMKKLTLTVMVLLAAALLPAVGGIRAESISLQPESFIDVDGDGINDHANDTDNDGIPDEFVPPRAKYVDYSIENIAEIFDIADALQETVEVEETGSHLSRFNALRFATRDLASCRGGLNADDPFGSGLGVGTGGGVVCEGGVCRPR